MLNVLTADTGITVMNNAAMRTFNVQHSTFNCKTTAMRKPYMSQFLGKAFISFLFIFSILKGNAQTDINIGSGATGNLPDELAGGYPCPIQDYYEGARSQYLFRASE